MARRREPRLDSRRCRPRLRAEPLERRILLSASWVDADTGESLAGPTAGDDVFHGDWRHEVADGLGGDDQLFGGGGNDRLSGGDGSDLLVGGAGDDDLRGGAGDDVLRGGAGSDRVDGGEGHDVVSYADASGGVRVDLTLGTRQDTGGGGLDTLRNVEGVRGSLHADTFVFSRPEPGVSYTVEGGGGRDTIDLSAFGEAEVRLASDARSLEVALPGGGSFRIEMQGVARVALADGEIDVEAALAAARAARAAPAGGDAGPLGGAPGGPGEGVPAPALDAIREHLAGGASGHREAPLVPALEVHDPAAHLPPGVEIAGEGGLGHLGFEAPVEAHAEVPDADPFFAVYELESEEPLPDPPAGPARGGAGSVIPEGGGGRFEDHFELEGGDALPAADSAGAEASDAGDAAAGVAAGSGSFLARLLTLVRSSVRPGERGEGPREDEEPERELPSR